MSHKLFNLLSVLLIVTFALAGCALFRQRVSQPHSHRRKFQWWSHPHNPHPQKLHLSQPPPRCLHQPPTELPKVTITWWHIQVADDQKALWQQDGR